MAQDLAARVVAYRKNKKKELSRQRMENMRNKRSAAAVKGDKKVKRKLEAIKKYDREREPQSTIRKQK